MMRVAERFLTLINRKRRILRPGARPSLALLVVRIQIWAGWSMTDLITTHKSP